MAKKFSVEAVVEEAPRDSKRKEPNTEIIRGDGQDRLLRFTVYDDTPQEIQNGLKTTITWHVAYQMSSGHTIKAGEKYEITRIIP